jgi:peptidyl-prolyl cis-trans isomerase A (cyclophilin A)
MLKNIFLILTFAAAGLMAGCDESAKTNKKTVQESEKQIAVKKTVQTKVRIETSKGNIVVELDTQKAPVTCKNFLQYVNKKYYDGTIFHRVIKGFMIQGGGMDAQMYEKPTRPSIINEAKNGLKNDRGTIAMARKPNPDSATSQFFINQVNNDSLNYGVQGAGYAVFGKVIEGMDVVDKIAEVSTTPGDVPSETVLIKSIRIE